MKAKISLALTFILVFSVWGMSSAQQAHKTKNMVLILIDGYRWQELFRGAEFDLLANKKYNPDDSLQRMKKYWAKNENYLC